jgi:DNA-directed RNA polymerase beta' subunit
MSEEEIQDISLIQFGVLSPEEIKSMAVCKIGLSPEEMKEYSKLDKDKSYSYMIGPHSIYDERMGCMPDTNESCVTCGQKKDCPGHFGYIELAEPVIHPLYYKMVATFLKCFCKQCYRILITEDVLSLTDISKRKGESRFNKILEKIDKIDICPYCSASQPKVVFNKTKDKTKETKICLEYKEKKGDKIQITMEVDDIKKIFDDISIEDFSLLGFDPDKIQPKNLILTYLPVIPTCSRPYVVTDGNIGNDDLTQQYLEILKLNYALQKENMSIDKRQKASQSLRFRIWTMMDNSKGRAKHPTDSRPLKGLKERLDKKNGRLRANLCGKRVNFSSRTVIGADPTLKLNQLGIPYEVAQILTKPETVTSFNIKSLTEIVNSGKANLLVRIRRQKDENGEETGPEIKSRKNLQYAIFRKGTEMIYGDIIVRGKVKESELKKDRSGKIVISEDKKNLNFIHVKTGKEILKEGDRLIRDGKFIEVTYPSKQNIKLEIGDIVHRQLQAGDWLLFNRQPLEYFNP